MYIYIYIFIYEYSWAPGGAWAEWDLGWEGPGPGEPRPAGTRAVKYPGRAGTRASVTRTGRDPRRDIVDPPNTNRVY